MGIITTIKKCTRKKDCANIYIDDEYTCCLQTFVVLSEGLKVGQDVEKSELDRLQLLSDGETAFSKVLNYIGVRMRSVSEIRQYLAKKEYAEVVINSVISKLEKYNYLNDEIFAKEYVNSAAKRSGVRMIKMKLKRFGVSDELVSTNLDNITGQEELAYKYAVKYLKHKPYDRNKLGNHLQSKGFDWDTISSAVNRVKGERDDTDM